MRNFLKQIKLCGRRRRNVFRLVRILVCLQILGIFLLFLSDKPENTDTDHVSTLVLQDSARETTLTAVVIKTNKTRLDKKLEAQGKMEARLQRIEKFCSTANSGREDPLKNKRVAVSVPNNFLHCPITKAASTFWFRFLRTLDIHSPMKSPYSFPLLSVMAKSSTPLFTLPNSFLNKTAFVKSAVRNVFVRDPFSRMLSAYVDKVFAPNPYFWKLWGAKAIRYFRKSPDHLSCGSDVTFSEVMSYANMKLRTADIHFQPVSSLCQPCAFRYNFVGKMETFKQDVVYLSQSLNISIVPYLQSKEFIFDYVKDTITDSINSPFSWMKDIRPCMSKQEMGLRVWRKLQLRGIISRRLPFPYLPEVFEQTTAHQFIDTAVKAHERSTDRDELKQQKTDAFLEAYSTVNMKGLTKLMGAFKADFDLFGYDDHPASVYSIGENITRGAFDWSREWVAA